MEPKITKRELLKTRKSLNIWNPRGSRKRISIIEFVENLLRDNLDISHPASLQIERAHWVLRLQPNSHPRSILVKFSSFRTKETVENMAKEGFALAGETNKDDKDRPVCLSLFSPGGARTGRLSTGGRNTELRSSWYSTVLYDNEFLASKQWQNKHITEHFKHK